MAEDMAAPRNTQEAVAVVEPAAAIVPQNEEDALTMQQRATAVRQALRTRQLDYS